MNLISEFALPVPLTIIGRILGVPEEDPEKFSRWTKAYVMIGAPNLRLTVVPDQVRWRGGFIVRGLEALPVAL